MTITGPIPRWGDRPREVEADAPREKPWAFQPAKKPEKEISSENTMVLLENALKERGIDPGDPQQKKEWITKVRGELEKKEGEIVARTYRDERGRECVKLKITWSIELKDGSSIRRTQFIETNVEMPEKLSDLKGVEDAKIRALFAVRAYRQVYKQAFDPNLGEKFEKMQGRLNQLRDENFSLMVSLLGSGGNWPFRGLPIGEVPSSTVITLKRGEEELKEKILGFKKSQWERITTPLEDKARRVNEATGQWKTKIPGWVDLQDPRWQKEYQEGKIKLEREYQAEKKIRIEDEGQKWSKLSELEKSENLEHALESANIDKKEYAAYLVERAKEDHSQFQQTEKRLSATTPFILKKHKVKNLKELIDFYKEKARQTLTLREEQPTVSFNLQDDMELLHSLYQKIESLHQSVEKKEAQTRQLTDKEKTTCTKWLRREDPLYKKFSSLNQINGETLNRVKNRIQVFQTA